MLVPAVQNSDLMNVHAQYPTLSATMLNTLRDDECVAFGENYQSNIDSRER
jgi:hypothetical protein